MKTALVLAIFLMAVSLHARTATVYASDLCWSGRFTETGELPCSCWKLTSPTGQTMQRGCRKDPGHVWCHRDTDCPSGIDVNAAVIPSQPVLAFPPSKWSFSW